MTEHEHELTKMQKLIGWLIAVILIIITLMVIYFIVSGIISGIISYVTGPLSDSPEYTQEEIREKMEIHLYEKYGEEFVVNRIGRRRFGDTVFYQGQIYPERFIGTNRQWDDYYHAEVNIDILESGELRDPGDTYGRVLARKRAEEYLMPKTKEIFGDRVKMKVGISYFTRNIYGTMAGYLSSDFDMMLENSIHKPEDHRLMLDLDVYIFKRIENEAEKEERREQIFEFVQYLKEVGLFEYLELGVIFIDERVLAPSYDDFAREIRTTREVREVIEGEAVRMPPRELRERMSIELQSEVEEMSEEELMASMERIRKSDLENFIKYDMQYVSLIYSYGILEEKYSSSITDEDKRLKDERYNTVENILIEQPYRHIYRNLK